MEIHIFIPILTSNVTLLRFISYESLVGWLCFHQLKSNTVIGLNPKTVLLNDLFLYLKYHFIDDVMVTIAEIHKTVCTL